MFSAFDTIYFVIYIFSLILSYLAVKENIRGLLFLRLILILGLITEIAVLILKNLALDDNEPYYLYIPLEYFLLIFFYREQTDEVLIKKIMKISLYVYALAVLFLSTYIYHFKGYPSIIYNISCLLNTIWIITIFFNLQMLDGLPIVSIPVFWILSALLIFYSGIFFFNATYQYFLNRDSNLAKMMRQYINTGLNYILYLFLSYAFVLSWKKKKFSYQ